MRSTHQYFGACEEVTTRAVVTRQTQLARSDCRRVWLTNRATLLLHQISRGRGEQIVERLLVRRERFSLGLRSLLDISSLGVA